MPVYEYRCRSCGEVTSLEVPVGERQRSVACSACRGRAERIISRLSVHRSRASKLQRLDPKYDRMVDRAMAGSTAAEPDRLLRRMKPFRKDP